MKKTLTDVTIKNADLGEVEAVFSTFDVVDHDGDVTLKGAFTEGASVVISAYNHTSHGGALPVGYGTIHEVGNQAVMKGKFLMETAHGRDTFATVKALSEQGLQEWSYSLHDVKSRRGEVDGKNVRIIERVGLVKEVSPVLLGAGIDTRTLAVKDGLTKFSELKSAALGGVAELVETAVERLALRAAEGKSITEQVEAYDEAIAALEPLRKAIAEHNTPTPPTTDLDEVEREFARFVALSRGAHL